ncbi:MAG TPA: c-type cytochrome [Vicinamibacterales bacterium]
MRTRHVVLIGALAAVIILAVVAVWRLKGLSTREQPTATERVLARATRRLAIPRDGRKAVNPVSFSPEVWAESRAHFADHCASCHANDGSGQTEIGQRLYPKAPDMRLEETQELTDGELYWIIENGIRLTGMPSWGPGGGGDLDTWKLVHFIRRLKELTAEQLDEMKALNPRSPEEIREELEDQRFLAGEPVEPLPTGASHPH